MNQRVQHLIRNPFQVQLADVALLQDEIEKYPYFSTLRSLLLFAMKEHQHSSYPAELKKTSIYSPSRVALYYYLQREQQEIAEPTENIVEQVEQRIQKPETTEPEIPIETPSQILTEVVDNQEPQINESDDTLSQTETDDLISNDEISNEEINQTEIVKEKTEVHISTDSEMSFSDWLSVLKPDSVKEKEKPSEKDIKYKLIDEFIEKSPKISAIDKTQKPETESNKPNIQAEYTDLMTETLAQIYVDQKKYDKAIRAYKILSLKYPDKKRFFEEQIQAIEELGN